MTCFPFTCGKRATSCAEPTIHIDGGVENIKFYTYKEVQHATENFSQANKIGQGGFGLVYKGKLRDGTLVAVKVLSAESRQGLREFVTELTVLANIEHENLVKILGCCVEGNHRILVSGYLENNSLSQTLLGQNPSSIDFNWRTRRNICLGLARGLTGYLAPEYALRGQLTRKADIYSFGILLLEIVCGRCNRNRRLPPGDQYLLQRAWRMLEKETLVELVDEAFREDLDIQEASKFLKIALLCTQEVPKLRPTMSAVVRMLQGEVDVTKASITRPGLLSDLDSRGKESSKGPTDMRNTSSLFSPSSGSSSLPSEQTDLTCANMTFTSISARGD
ncbi:hypothetical protein BVRB_4g086110 isoform A [Beta vulgaris subsp. vulgaris]|nr:hypothetical protein BVRB_4g086110 isoform A [Beta vulgaris subsp. vulgaris]